MRKTGEPIANYIRSLSHVPVTLRDVRRPYHPSQLRVTIFPWISICWNMLDLSWSNPICWGIMIYHDLTISNPNLIRSNNQNSMTGCFTIFHRMGCPHDGAGIPSRFGVGVVLLPWELRRSDPNMIRVLCKKMGIFPKVLSFGMQFHVYYIYIL